MNTITVTHVPSGRARTFDHPRDAVAFVNECLSRKIAEKDLLVDNRSGVALSVYTDRIPVWAQDLIYQMEKDHGGNIVPKWHFIIPKKRKYYSGGHTWYRHRDNAVTHISISRGIDDLDFKGVIIHEFAHALMHANDIDTNHGRAFYRCMFDLLRRYCTPDQEKRIVEREFRYKKSSRYWYAEMYNIEEILSQYQPARAAAVKKPKPTTEDIVNSLFED